MIKSKRHETELTVFLSGEIDHCTSSQMREDIEFLWAKRQATHLILDFSNVSFMDSSGIGMIIGRYKTVSSTGGTISASGLHPPIDRLFHMAGLHRILRITDHIDREENKR